MKKLNEEIWKKSKPAKKFPKDWFVIPVLDVLDILEKDREELKKEWRLKCNRMEVMSGDVAIFELSRILDKIFSEGEWRMKKTNTHQIKKYKPDGSNEVYMESQSIVGEGDKVEHMPVNVDNQSGAIYETPNYPKSIKAKSKSCEQKEKGK